MQDYLSDEDRFFIRLNYTNIHAKLRTADIIQGLSKFGFFNGEDHAFFEQWKSEPDADLTEYIIFNVLLKRATYEHLQHLWDVLLKTQPEVLQYFPEVKVKEETPEENNNDVTGLDECIVAAAFPESQPDEPVTVDVTGNTLTAASEPVPSHIHNTKAGQADRIETVVQPADEPDGKPKAGIIKSLKNRLSFRKKKKRSKEDFKLLENASTENPGQQQTTRAKTSVGTQVPDAEHQPLNPAGLKHLFGQNQKKQVRRISSFTDAFLHYKFKDKGKPYGTGMCVIFALFTQDLPGYVHDVKNVENHFKDLQYEVWSGSGYTNITREELLQKIAAVTAYVDHHKTFDRLVVVILTHGKKDGLLTCEDRDGFIEEQKPVKFMRDGRQYSGYIPVKTTVEEIVEHFKHDRLKSMKDMPKLFLIQACRGQGVVQAANVRKQKGLDEVDASGIDTSQLQFNTQTPIDGDILVCNATTEHHSSLVNPYTGSWFIQKTLEVFKKYQKSEHVVDMMTVVNLAVSECRGAVYPKNADPYKAIQIPCMVSSLRKKFYLYNAQHENGNQEISLPMNVQLPPQFVDQRPTVSTPVRSQPMNIQYPPEPRTQTPQLPPLHQPQYGSTQPYPVSYSNLPRSVNLEPQHQAPQLHQRQPGQQSQVHGERSGIYQRQSPQLHKRQRDSSNRILGLQQHGNGSVQGNHSSKMPTYTTVKPLVVYHAGSPEHVLAKDNEASKAPLVASEDN